MLSTPAFSTPVIWCRVFHSRVFHPCHLVPSFPLPRFPPLSSGAEFSTPAFSTLVISCHVFHSRVFHPCHLVPSFPLPRFPLPRFTRPRPHCLLQDGGARTTPAGPRNNLETELLVFMRTCTAIRVLQVPILCSVRLVLQQFRTQQKMVSSHTHRVNEGLRCGTSAIPNWRHCKRTFK